MKVFTKESLKRELQVIKEKGWVRSGRPGNDGSVGNTLEDLLGIEENNLPLPNAGEWEIKGQRKDSTSLITLFHMEPSPRALKLVPSLLLPKYGWPHKNAGSTHPKREKSFRMTLTAGKRTNRGFTVVVNREVGRVEISFDHASVDRQIHRAWLRNVKRRIGVSELDPQPYWGFDDLYHKAGTKLHKTLYAIAERKLKEKTEFFRYTEFLMLEDFKKDFFIEAIEQGDVQIDFDARTGHNHGTKFRLRQYAYSKLYGSVKKI